MLPQWQIKDPGHPAKSAGGRLHLNKHAHLTQQSRCGLTMLWSRHSVETYPGTRSHATCQGTLGHSHQLAGPLWTDPGVKSGISLCELISTSKKKKGKRKSAGGERMSEHSPTILTTEEKATTTTTTTIFISENDFRVI